MAPFGAVEADRYDHSLHSGTSFIGCGVDLIHVADLVGFELQPGLEIAFDVKGVFRVGVSGVLVVGVLGDVVLVRQKRAHTTQLQDALAAVHDGQLILAHKLFTTMSSDEFKMGKKIPLLIMRRGIKCDIQKLDSQLLNNIA